MKTYIYTRLAIIMVLLSSCSKWLDVKPEDKFLEEDVFSTPQGFTDALNGLYVNMGSSSMYGKDLTMTTFDVLAQYYYISPQHSGYLRQLNVYNYEDVDVKNKISSIWGNYYLAIANANKLLENLEARGHLLDEQTRQLFTGETLALRSFLYFELLRTFAPNYTKDSTTTIIPYQDKVSPDFSEYKTSQFIMEHVIADLKKAENLLLKSDPVLNEIVVDKTNEAVEAGKRPYMTYRNYRLNYYAVKALQARVNLWRGDKVSALAAAKVVMDNKNKFPWITQTAINDPSSPNRIFSTELLFAVENPRLYQVYNETYSPSLQDNSILAAGVQGISTFLNNVYESVGNDYRYTPMWRSDGGKIYPTFKKYQDITITLNRNHRFTVPMIRLSEVFLIAAESETNTSKAFGYLNELKLNRNTYDIAETSKLQDNIMKEYRKEFYGEGQLWFYYKRTLTTSILSANSSATNIQEGKFTFPLPLSETEPR